MTQADADIALIERSSHFSLTLLDNEEKYADPGTPYGIHASVLRPLLARADACWVYGIGMESALWQAARDMLTPARGKFRVDTRGGASADPVTGREVFWNARGGKRGTIVMTLPLADFPAGVFSACLHAGVMDNYRAGHTPAAVKFAQQAISGGTHIAVCLPRNNGIEWMDLFAPKPLVFELYARARAACKGKPQY
jgi:hypothetical protein